MNLKGKKILILTGCNGASDIIEYAKKNGVYTIATDYYKVSPIKDMADCRYDVSTTDIEALYDIAKKHHVDGITTGTSETSMYSILQLSKRLNIPFYATSKQLETINNKRKFKELLRSYNVPIIKEYLFTGSMSEEELEKIEYPVIFKPVDSSGAKGISICRNEHELSHCYEYALKYSRIKQVLVEKYLKNIPETFINYTIINGIFSVSCAFDIIRKQYYKQDELIGLPVIYMLPSNNLQLYIDLVNPQMISALKSIGIKNGTMSIQCFFDGKSFYIYEAGYRLGGGQMYIFTDKLNGINVMEMMVNYSLTGKMSDIPYILSKDNPFFTKPCCQLNISLKPGKIAVLNGINEIKELDGVINVTEVHQIGDEIKVDGSIGQLCLRIHIIADTKEILANIIDEIYATIVINNENGDDMLLDRYKLVLDN
jgi:hypothetical protein